MAEITYFYPAAAEATKKSIGLVFEPNLFTIYYYGDIQGEQPLAYQVFDASEKPETGFAQGLTPLFAAEFTKQHTLVPHSMFDESDNANLLKFTTSFQGAKPRLDQILGYGADLISNVNESTDAFVRETFPGLRVRHILGSLLELGRTVVQGDNPVLLIYRSGSLLSISVLSHKELLFSNSVESMHLEDMYYFIHYTSKQLDLTNTSQVYVFGSEEDRKPIMAHLSEFFRNIKLGFKTNQEILAEADTAAHWLGIHASKCVL